MNTTDNHNPQGAPLPPPFQPNSYQPQAPQQSGKGARGPLIAIIFGLLLIGGGVAAFFLLRDQQGKRSAADTDIAIEERAEGTERTKELSEAKGMEETEGVDLEIDSEEWGRGGDDGGTDSGQTVSDSENDPEVQQVRQRLSHFQYASYHNDRFNYIVAVPDFMAPGPESQNGDGCQFYFNGITLSTYASHNALENDAAQEISLRDAHATRHYLDSRSFHISGKDDAGRLYEEKAVLKGDVWYTVKLSYPAKYQPVIAPLSQIVTNFEP